MTLIGTVILVALVATILTSMARPIYGLIALAILLPFNGDASRLLSPVDATIYGGGKDALLLLLLAVVVTSGRIRRVPPFVVYSVVLILLFAVASGTITQNPEQAIYGFRNNYLPLLLLIVAPALLDNSKSIRLVATAMVLVAQIASIYAIVTNSLGLDWLFTTGVLPAHDGAFPYQFFTAGDLHPRAFSPYTSPTLLGASLVVSVAVLWGSTTWTLRRRFILSILPVAGVLLSEARSAQLGLVLLAVALIARSLSRDRGRGLALGLISIVALGMAAYVTWFVSTARYDVSFAGHGASLVNTVPMVLQTPLGLGLGTVGPRALLFNSDATLSESSLVVIALESGWLPMLLVAAVLLWTTIRCSRYDGNAFIGVAAIAASAVPVLVLPLLQDSVFSYSLYLAMGMGLGSTLDVPQPTMTGTRGPRHRPRLAVNRRGFVD